MKISVFIPTYNGRNRLIILLNKLKQQTVRNFEVHVLIDGSTDNTIDLNKQFPEVHFHTYTNKGRAGIRNEALRICKTDLIMFLDDDMIPENNLIEKYQEYHLKEPDSIIVGNGFRNPDEAKTDFDKYLIKEELGWKEKRAETFIITHDSYAFTSCNLSMPFSIFKSLGGFDIVLKDGEDFDFAMRALNAGVKMIYDRTLIAWHNDWPDLKKYIKRNSEYLKGKKALILKNPDYDRFLNYSTIEKSEFVFFKRIIMKILADSALKENLLYKISPLSLRFLSYRSAIYLYSKA
ncbi:MAG: glycosyltransferase family 2 protein [Bacteroidia bacterium]